jgi:hypothetical protein
MADQPTWRVIASHGNRNKEHETVNIVTVRAAADQLSIKAVLQAGAVSGFKTVIPAVGTQRHLRTIFISGYSGPA